MNPISNQSRDGLGNSTGSYYHRTPRNSMMTLIIAGGCNTDVVDNHVNVEKSYVGNQVALWLRLVEQELEVLWLSTVHCKPTS
jgi:hypothetical protein